MHVGAAEPGRATGEERLLQNVQDSQGSLRHNRSPSCRRYARSGAYRVIRVRRGWRGYRRSRPSPEDTFALPFCPCRRL